MKRFEIVVLDLAKDDIRDARKWYNKRQFGLGLRLHQDMKNTLISIERNPTSFAIRYGITRLANFEIFPYAVHFFITIDSVIITGFIHTSRHEDTGRIRR